MLKRKKGQMTIFLIVMLVVLFLGLMLLFVGGVSISKASDSLDIDVDMGQVNLKDYNQQTFAKAKEMYVVNADWWGISLILGLVLGLFLSSYFLRGSFPKVGIIFDIFIILAVFIASLYLSAAYQDVLDALATAGETFLEDSAAKSSMFMLNLPVFIVIIGVVMMIIFHASLPKRPEERIQEGGFLQGVQ